METLNLSHRRSERGFTLVELAIVMIIIGLLIAGILKGQELIANARVTATVSQLKGIDAAVSTFRDSYDALPGDIQNVVNRLPGCANLCAGAGNGNGQVENFTAAPAGERQAFFAHLAAANLISGINHGAAVAGSNAWGVAMPEAELSGGVGIQVGSSTGAVGDTLTVTGIAAPRSGLYLHLTNAANAAGGTAAMSPNVAFRIDTKLDDGLPNAGSVFAAAPGAAIAACAANAPTSIYLESDPADRCSLYVRIQN